jgi:hypothetical protein
MDGRDGSVVFGAKWGKPEFFLLVAALAGAAIFACRWLLRGMLRE